MFNKIDWAHIPEHINPVFFSLGPIQVHWYGLMYAVAFFVVYSMVRYRIRNEHLNYAPSLISDFMTWAIVSLLIGGRLGYVLFYNLPFYLKNPLAIISPFDFTNGFHYIGIYGMSYHGALIGVILAFVLFCSKHKIAVWPFADLFAPVIPLAYTFGRLGNFINGELYGRVTTVPWGMYFPLAPTMQLRHPSQLYEAACEGFLLFVVLWSLRRLRLFDGFLSGMYLIGYGLARFCVEFTREPDPQLGLVLGPFTLGQIFCAIMIILGFLILKNRKSGCSLTERRF